MACLNPLQVCDFDLSKAVPEGMEGGGHLAASGACDTEVNSPAYASPEYIKACRDPQANPYSNAMQLPKDVYSFGVVLWEIITLQVGEPPWSRCRWARPPLGRISSFECAQVGKHGILHSGNWGQDTRVLPGCVICQPPHMGTPQVASVGASSGNWRVPVSMMCG